MNTLGTNVDDHQMLGWQAVDLAFKLFDLWRAENDPDFEMDLLEAAAAYSDYADKNGIQKYIDALSGGE